MASQLERPRDVVSGLLVLGTGAAFLCFGRGLAIGTASRMGPGYFPVVLSLLMMGLGLAIVVNALRAPAGGSVALVLPWRALVLVFGAIVFFAVTLKGLGLLVSLAISAFLTAWASRCANWRSSAAMAFALSLFCTVVFVSGLGLPMPVVGPWLSFDYWLPSVSAVP